MTTVSPFKKMKVDFQVTLLYLTHFCPISLRTVFGTQSRPSKGFLLNKLRDGHATHLALNYYDEDTD